MAASPPTWQTGSAEDIEEERRLLYVAMTRSKYQRALALLGLRISEVGGRQSGWKRGATERLCASHSIPFAGWVLPGSLVVARICWPRRSALFTKCAMRKEVWFD
jgi:superfamily I DNA/RNA helicase